MVMIDGSIVWYSFPFFIAIAFYWYLTKSHNHWSSLGIYHLKPSLIVGNYGDRILMRKSLHSCIKNMYNQFKGHRFGGFFEGPRPCLMVLDPELLKCILIRDSDHFINRPLPRFNPSLTTEKTLLSLRGQKWRSVRKLLTPVFSSSKLKLMDVLVKSCAKQMENYLDKSIIEKGNNNACKEIEMKDFFGRYSIDTIATCAFGIQCDSLQEPNSEFHKIMSKIGDISIMERIKLSLLVFLAPNLSEYFSVSFFNKHTTEFLCDVVIKTKRHRHDHPESRRIDLLQLLIDAEVDYTEDTKDPVQENGSSKELNKKSNNDQVMTEDIIVAQALLVLAGGYETSSSLLSFASYELALNSNIQDKLRKEVLTVLDKYQGECNYSALNEMTYMEMVLNETLRKYPPFSRADRECTRQYTIPGSNIVIKPGDYICVPVIGIHHDPDYYPDPEKFDPERFAPENKNQRSPYVFLPFGAGPRNCLGLRFAMMTTKFALTHLIKKYELAVCSRTEIPITEHLTSIVLNPEKGIWLNVKRL